MNNNDHISRGEIHNTLSKLNVNEYTQNKGGFTYLSWPFAWGTLMKHFPNTNYQHLEDKVFADADGVEWKMVRHQAEESTE